MKEAIALIILLYIGYRFMLFLLEYWSIKNEARRNYRAQFKKK